MARLPTFSDKKDFNRLFRRGGRTEEKLFTVWVVPNQLSYDRFVFAVSKSIEKRSTTRNKIRRRVREWFRKNIQKEQAQRHLDIFLSFKKEVVTISKTKLYEELAAVSKKIFKNSDHKAS